MSFNRRVISMFSVVVMLLAACGGSDSSSRTKNSALCYATQEEKDAAVKAAQDAFDAAMGNVVIEEQPEGVPTSTTVSEEQPEVISETTVPTLEEALGQKDFEIVAWHILLAPAQTPPDVLARLRKETLAITSQPRFTDLARALGLIVAKPQTPDEIRKMLAAERERWGLVMEKAGLKHSR